jgi:hypothetical protein
MSHKERQLVGWMSLNTQGPGEVGEKFLSSKKREEVVYL